MRIGSEPMSHLPDYRTWTQVQLTGRDTVNELTRFGRKAALVPSAIAPAPNPCLPRNSDRQVLILDQSYHLAKEIKPLLRKSF